MSDALTIQVDGLRETQRALQRIGDRDLNVAMKAANKVAAQTVADVARARAPSRSGALRASIRPSVGALSAKVRAGGPSVPYAGVIHWGWPRHHIAKRPFLFDALEAERAVVAETYRVSIDRLLAILAHR